MSEELIYLQQKVNDIESNMASKSDIMIMSGRLDGIDALAVELGKNTEAVTAILKQNARDEEARKHQIKEIDRVITLADKNSAAIQTLKEIAAADKPVKSLITWAARIAIGIIMTAILSAAFVVAK